ncbi:MAG TPA: helix-turn-helix domain-containing protein [Limnochordia bacterium]
MIEEGALHAPEENGDGWIPLKEAARRLGISLTTARRWIKDGKLPAELRPGAYGDQYMVPERAVDTAQQIHDVVKVDRQADLVAFAQALEGYLSRRDAALVGALESDREAVTTELARVRAELEATRQQVAAATLERDRRAEERDRRLLEAIRALQAERRRGFWGRLVNR